MVNNLATAASFFRSLSYGKKLTVLSAVVLVISLPTLLFVLTQPQNIASKADTTTLIEAESGTLSGNAVVKSSETASGGKYIVLNATTPTPRPPTPTWKPYPSLTPRPSLRPTVTPTPRPTATPTPTPTPGHGLGNDNKPGNDR